MSLPLVLLIVWLTGLPLAFVLTVLLYPPHLRRTIRRLDKSSRGAAVTSLSAWRRRMPVEGQPGGHLRPRRRA